MKSNDNRKFTSPENAKLSTGPKTEAGKQRSAMNATRHGAYSKKVLLPGEDPEALNKLVECHIQRFKPQDEIEHMLVRQMAHTLWRSFRQAPAEASLISIQMLRITPTIQVEFEAVTAEDLQALAGASLHANGQGPYQLSRLEQRLLRQYDSLRQQFFEMRQLCPLPPPDHKPQPDNNIPSEPESVETNLTRTPQPSPVFDPHSEAFAFLPAIGRPAAPNADRRSPLPARHATH